MNPEENQTINNLEQPTIITRADRLRTDASAPDFSIPEIRPASDFFSESVMKLDPDMLSDMMRQTGVHASVGEQTSVAIENALMGMNQLGDETRIAFGNVANYFTGGRVGDELAKIAYDSMAARYREMAINEDAIGGITSEIAKLAAGSTSFLQLALEGLATAGTVPLIHIGVQEFGQGTFNDMQDYAEKHDGSLEGYAPEGFDLAANMANALLQVGIESWLGVGSPRFLLGASRGLWAEGLSGALQEGVQGALSDLTEAVKGNEEISVLLDNAEDYLRDAVVGGILQGSLGAITHHQHYARAVNNTAEAIAKARGLEMPTAKEKEQAKAIIDAKMREEASLLTQEFKAAFDASTGEGKLQQKIATELKRAVEDKELDLDTANETDLAQKIEGIATQETLNAMDLSREQNRSVAEMELNKITYRDGDIWLEGLEPELGDRAVDYSRVLYERQQREPQKILHRQYITEGDKEPVRQKAREVLDVLQQRGKEVVIRETGSGKVYVSNDGAIYLTIDGKKGRIAPEIIMRNHPDNLSFNINSNMSNEEIADALEEVIGERAKSHKTDDVNKGFFLEQAKASGKAGDKARGAYDDVLKRIVLKNIADVSTLQHEFAHYWMQNNFKWARSGLASEDWLNRWRAVEDWLGIKATDRLLSKTASEKFARAYERYILEGRVAPELQWAFEGFQKAYQDIYDETEKEYFGSSEKLSPEVIDWFNRNKEMTPKRQLDADQKKVEKALTLAAGVPVIEDVDGSVVMTEQNKEGDPVVYMGVKESEIPAGDNLLVQADKTTSSKLQQSAKRWLSDKVEVQQLTTLDTQATLENFKNWIARDRQGAWNTMMNPDTRPIYRTYLYKAFAQEAMNDADLAVELANIDMGQAVREMGQAIQALDIRNESGFDTLEIMRNIEKSKGNISTEELNKAVESMGLDMVELSQEEIDEVEFDTECKL